MYRVKLQNFEGPLDLLLFFIKRDELDIYDIPVSYITNQFLEYIRFMDELDLTIASEFILMASTLMAIKAKMMLPKDENDLDEDPEDDPRYELVQALLEYKRFKEMSEELHVLDQKNRQRYYRGNYEPDYLEPEIDNGEVFKDVTLFDLMAAFKKVMIQMEREEVVHKVEKEPSTIEEQGQFLVKLLELKGRLSFVEVCQEVRNKLLVVVTFLSALELIKEQKLLLFADSNPTDFYLELNPDYSQDEAVMVGGTDTSLQ